MSKDTYIKIILDYFKHYKDNRITQDQFLLLLDSLLNFSKEESDLYDE